MSEGIRSGLGRSEEALLIEILLLAAGGSAEPIQSLAGLLAAAQARIAVAEIEERGNVLRIQRHRALQSVGRLVEPAHTHERDAKLG